MGGASAVPLTALSLPTECFADAPGSDPTGHAVGRAGRFAAVFHRTDVHDVHRVGGRIMCAAGGADGVWDAHRRWPGPGVAALPGAPVLFRRALVPAPGWSAAGRADRGASAGDRCPDHAGRR